METKRSMQGDQAARKLTRYEKMRMKLKDQCCSNRAEAEIIMEKPVVPPMHYTFGSIPTCAAPDHTMQIFSVKVSQLKKESDLRWPLQVYGFIAIRDSIYPRRNLLFQRDRSNCQTITEEEPFLLLTGPSRGVVLIDPAIFIVELKAKGKTESSNDILLAADGLTTLHPGSYSSPLPHTFKMTLHGIRSKLEFSQAVLEHSVESTIMVELVKGSWPESIRGRVAASTASIPDQDIVLVDSEDGAMSFNDYDVLKLSRDVVTVKLRGELKVKVVAFHRNGVQDMSFFFKPKTSTISYQRCDLNFCILGITVAWSVFLPLP